MTVNGKLVARFLEENTLEERVLLQRQRDLEEQSLREAVVGKQTVKGKEPERREDFELDLTTIPLYEEYR